MQTQERALAGRDSEGTHTELSRFTSTHTFTDPLSTLHGSLSNQQHLPKSSSICTAPLSAQDPCPDPGPSYALHKLPTHLLVQPEVLCMHTHTHKHTYTHTPLIYTTLTSPLGCTCTDPLPAWYPSLDSRTPLTHQLVQLEVHCCM